MGAVKDVLATFNGYNRRDFYLSCRFISTNLVVYFAKYLL